MTPRRVLRTSAVVHFGVGLALLAATWDGLYDAFAIPDPDPAIYAQLAGAFSVGVGYVVWRGTKALEVGRAAAGAAAVADALAVVVGGAWLVEGRAVLPGSGKLAALMLLLGAIAAAQWRVARQ